MIYLLILSDLFTNIKYTIIFQNINVSVLNLLLRGYMTKPRLKGLKSEYLKNYFIHKKSQMQKIEVSNINMRLNYKSY